MGLRDGCLLQPLCWLQLLCYGLGTGHWCSTAVLRGVRGGRLPSQRLCPARSRPGGVFSLRFCLH